MRGWFYPHEWDVSHIWMSHCTYMTGSCHAYERVMSRREHIISVETVVGIHVNECVSLGNASCQVLRRHFHANEWVTPHLWISHVTATHEPHEHMTFSLSHTHTRHAKSHTQTHTHTHAPTHTHTRRDYFNNAVEKFVGKTCCVRLSACSNYVMYEKNPIMPAIYVLFVGTGFTVFALVCATPLCISCVAFS